jgi:hypothetical protein
MFCLEGTVELEVLVTLEFRVTVAAKSNEVFESLVLVLEDYEETEVYDIDALLDLSTNTISLTAASKSLSFRDAESGARRVLEELFARSLTSASEGVLVSVSAEARPEKLLSSL